MKLKPKDWEKHQQYKDRKPKWIKLHTELLNDYSYSFVQIGTKATLPLLWLLACEYEDGGIDATIEEISFRIHIDKNTVQAAIDELIKIGLYESVQVCTESSLEKRREEKRESILQKEKFSFNLSTKKTFDNLSSGYVSKLESYITDSKYSLGFEHFKNTCLANGYKYKNFSFAYNNWAKKEFNKPKEEGVQLWG